MGKESTSEDGWRAFIELCSRFKGKELGELFDLFLTLEEKEDIGNRFRIVKALAEEKLTQREISEKLGVSISKITRGSNALKIISGQLREALKEQMLP
jgi:TrpR family trp operon transcriptional repressor